MTSPWIKLADIVAALHRSVDRAEEQLSGYYEKARESALRKDVKEDAIERNVGFAISQFRVSLPIEVDMQKDEVVARFPDHDAKERSADATARLTRIEFELKATPILHAARPKK